MRIARSSGEPVAGGRSPRWQLLVLLLPFLFACGGEEAPKEERLETVDVAPPLTLETADDPRQAAPEPQLSGVLPTDFPSDLPLYLPASLVDSETTASGASVTLLTGAPLSRVRDELFERARAQGWQVEPDAGGAALHKGSARVRLRVEDARPGTHYVYEY
jgi:hypothetical protein